MSDCHIWWQSSNKSAFIVHSFFFVRLRTYEVWNWGMSESSCCLRDTWFDGLVSLSPQTIASSISLSITGFAASVMFLKGWKSSSIGIEGLGCNFFKAIRLQLYAAIILFIWACVASIWQPVTSMQATISWMNKMLYNSLQYCKEHNQVHT